MNKGKPFLNKKKNKNSSFKLPIAAGVCHRRNDFQRGNDSVTL